MALILPSYLSRSRILSGTGIAAPWPVQAVSIIVFINGLSTILDVGLVRFPARLEGFSPFNYDYAKTLGVFAGFVLIYFASQLHRRKRVAWWIATGGSALIVAAHTVYARDISVLVLPVTSLLLLITYRELFNARSEPSSITYGLRLLFLTIAIAMVYGVAGFLFLLPRDFHLPFTLGDAIIRTLRQYTLIGNSDLVAHTRHAKWFLRSLNALGIAGLTLAVGGLFRPLAYRYRTLPHDRQRAKALLEKYGNSSEDFFKLWPEDKSYFFHSDCFVAYKVQGGIAFALGDVTGPVREQSEAITQFAAYCQEYGWTPCWVYISEKASRLARNLGLRSIKIGEEAVVDIARFRQETASNKHFRHVHNKFTKLGYAAEFVAPPHDPAMLRQIARVSRSWLGLPGKMERSFALGYFDRRYLAGCPLFVVRDTGNQVVAFANLIPSYDKQEANFDLMRHRADSPTGAMDFLFMSLAEELGKQGYTRLNLGLAPFSGLDELSDKSLEEHVVSLLYRSQFKFTNYQGLRRYKEKFEPNWEPRYLSYVGGPATLAKAAIAINRLVDVPRTK